MSHREKVQIRGYVGANGVGKTLLAVADSMRAPGPIFSTVRIESDRFVPICSFDDLLAADGGEHGGTVLLDEVQSIASSRQSATMPPEVLNFLMQLRKRNLQCVWTTPAWSRADVALREVTQTVTRIRGLFYRDNGTLWPSPRLMKVSTYDAVSMQNASQDKLDQFDEAKTLEVRYYRAKNLYKRSPYVSGESVLQLAAPSSGSCPRCGGRRRVPECRCEARSAAPTGGADAALDETRLLPVLP